MGVPSISIYVTELMQEYDVQKLIRVGTCGAIQKDVHVRDVILAQSASTDSKMNEIIFQWYQLRADCRLRSSFEIV